MRHKWKIISPSAIGLIRAGEEAELRDVELPDWTKVGQRCPIEWDERNKAVFVWLAGRITQRWIEFSSQVLIKKFNN